LLGSMLLIDSPAAELRVSLTLVAPVVAATAAILVFLVRLAVAAQRRGSVTGAAGMVGQRGDALTAMAAGGTGRVRVQGEIWSARSHAAVAAGEVIEVAAMNGLVLSVRRAPDGEEETC